MEKATKRGSEKKRQRRKQSSAARYKERMEKQKLKKKQKHWVATVFATCSKINAHKM